MKNTFVVKLAIAAILAVGSLAHAQDEITPIPAVDAPDATQVTNQASLSDNVAVEGQVDEVAPVAPVPESAVSNSAVATGSDCVGCGQALPMFSGRLNAGPISSGCSSCAQVSSGCSNCAQVSSGCSSCAQVSTGCSSCCSGSGCGSGCGAIQTATYVQPTNNCCGQIGQVSYDQPLYQSQVPSALASTPISIMTSPIVNPAPSPSTYTPSTYTPSPVYNPATTGSACGGGSTFNTPASVGTSYFNSSCNPCTSTRGRLRGRWFRR